MVAVSLKNAQKMEQYADDGKELWPNLEGARVGLVVPKYMDVDSIADLTDEANKTITGGWDKTLLINEKPLNFYMA